MNEKDNNKYIVNLIQTFCTEIMIIIFITQTTDRSDITSIEKIIFSVVLKSMSHVMLRLCIIFFQPHV